MLRLCDISFEVAVDTSLYAQFTCYIPVGQHVQQMSAVSQMRLVKGCSLTALSHHRSTLLNVASSSITTDKFVNVTSQTLTSNCHTNSGCAYRMESDPGFQAALYEARKSYNEGGVPIGACLISKDGRVLGKGTLHHR